MRKLTRSIVVLLLGCLIQCAATSGDYLSNQAREIHQQFWSPNAHLIDYLMKGTPYETPLFHFKGETDGPVVMILGGTHGNEPAGFEAAHCLLRQFTEAPIKSGEIFIIPETNRVADSLSERRIPVPDGMDIELGNLNRCYPGIKDGLPMEQMAYAITELIREHRVSLFLDLHESPVFHLQSREKDGSYHGLGQTLIYTINEEATWLAMVVLDQINADIPAGMEQFSVIESPIELSAAWSAGKFFQIPAFTVETCKQLPLEKRVKYQIDIVNIMLREKGMI
ncbi:MAG: succinylglutamate desuccinylase/aspartoacylase family protein [Candidatus Zhuqueibacterota bacterium]